jgi:hypothetical protein
MALTGFSLWIINIRLDANTYSLIILDKSIILIAKASILID